MKLYNTLMMCRNLFVGTYFGRTTWFAVRPHGSHADIVVGFENQDDKTKIDVCCGLSVNLGELLQLKADIDRAIYFLEEKTKGSK
jgi:hypothetical protein